MDCFTCHDCDKPCSAKFFPIEINNPISTNITNDTTATINSDLNDSNSLTQTQSQPSSKDIYPLCEQCYFRRQNLLCHACEGALRGSYITALGKKYHVEHFTCSLCSTVFGSSDSYYEHQDNIYCRYHYSTLYASRCEGCKTAILKQFVEVFRGGREQQWHPECFMINKFWNVMIFSGQTSAYPPLEDKSILESKLEPNPGDLEKKPINLPPPDVKLRDTILHIEQDTEKKSFHIWAVLCGYEEATAACISDMLQFATSCRYHETLFSTATFVAKIEVLLSAIDLLSAQVDPLVNQLIIYDNMTPEEQLQETEGFQNLMNDVRKASFTQLRKEPRTLCKKVVSFMSLLSKSRERSMKEPGSAQELLDSVTGMAHYLKLLIRHGLSNSLRYDRAFPGTNIIDIFLDQVATHDQIPANPLESLGVSGKASDRCMHCGNSTEDDCVTLGDNLWHLECLYCSRCNVFLGKNVENARYTGKIVICINCVEPNESVSSEFKVVTKLHQFVYLVKIALARLQLLLKTYDTRDKVKLKSPSRPPLVSNKSSSSSVGPRGLSDDQGYMTTLKDIRKLRSTRLSQRVNESSKTARRSRILDLPPSEQGFLGKNGSSTSLPGTVQPGAQLIHSKPQTLTVPTPRQLNNKDNLSAPKSPIITDQTFFPPPISDQKIDNISSLSTEATLVPSHFKIEEIPPERSTYSQLDRTTDLIRNEKSLILDDIPRIVAAEQARELRPNAYRHRMKEASMDEEVQVLDVHEKKHAPDRFMSDLSSSELFYARHVAISLMQPVVSKWFTMEELTDLIETRKSSSLWGKFGKAFSKNSNASSDTKNKKKSGVFGFSLEFQVEKYGVESTFGVGPGKLKIPAFVDECISAMRQMDMSVEGIFRKNGNIRRSKDLAEMVDKNPDKTGMFTDENPIQLAALFKKYLRDLPDSLLTFKLEKLWLVSQEIDDIEERKRLMHLICCLMPRSHRDVMEVLFYFLYWTASFSQIDEESGSKMDIHNLSTVITPNILYAKQKDNPTSSEGYFLAIEAVDVLIKEHDRYAKAPTEVLDIIEKANLESCGEASSKDILLKIQQYINEQGKKILAPDMSKNKRMSTSSDPSGGTKLMDLPIPSRPSPMRAHTDNGRSGNEQQIKQNRSPIII